MVSEGHDPKKGVEGSENLPPSFSVILALNEPNRP